MSLIVGVHGIGQQSRGAEILRSEWFPALSDGITLAGGKAPSPDSFRCAFYGDLFRKRGGNLKGDAEPDDWEERFVEALAWHAAQIENKENPRPVKGPVTAAAMRMGLDKALRILTRAPYFGQMLRAAVVTDVRQVRDYFFDGVVRKEARRRVLEQISPATRVVIAHSLGSVVAYEALAMNPLPSIYTLITLGSPLGMQGLVFQRLQPEPPGQWPSAVKRWLNVSDRGDIVAVERKLKPFFGEGVEDAEVDNGWTNAHSAVSYLTSSMVGKAITEGL